MSVKVAAVFPAAARQYKKIFKKDKSEQGSGSPSRHPEASTQKNFLKKINRGELLAPFVLLYKCSSIRVKPALSVGGSRHLVLNPTEGTR